MGERKKLKRAKLESNVSDALNKNEEQHLLAKLKEMG